MPAKSKRQSRTPKSRGLRAIVVEVSPEAKAEIEQAAAAASLPMATWARVALLAAARKARAQ